jgi:uncharacterized protein (TIGR03437 family)
MRSDQINAVGPYGIGGSTTSIQVEYNGQRSNPISAPVVADTLSAFTANSSGVGAAALNQVGQYSGQPCTSRLDRDVVCDRLGRTDPEGSDGRISGAVLAKRYYPSLLM